MTRALPAVGMMLRLRSARPVDVAGIVSLIDVYAEQGLMLSRTAESIELALQDYIVVVDGHERVLACGALREYSPSVAEVSAVAVAPDAQGLGLGTRIVRGVEHMAISRGIDEVFALTLATGFFAAAGYAIVDRAIYPEKIRRDCRGCARRFSCGETCVRHVLNRDRRAVAA